MSESDWSQSFRLPLQLPAPPIRSIYNSSRIAPLKAKIARTQIFAAYRELADLYLQLGRYDDAAATYRAEAVQYRKKGLTDAAVLDDIKAARYETDVRLFVDRFALPQELNTLYTGARAEPFVGCYVGAFIDRDDNLHQTFFDENWQLHRKPAEFAAVVGKPHGSYFMYLSYGQKFPSAWIQHCKDENVIPQIAWEPANLNQVQDNAYLRSFAEACGAMDWPIFIRYASEMNGYWTPYHNNPKLYRAKFRLINRVLHQYAPRVATIWCVNNPPLNNVQDYYPGDDGCDWVGVNLYSVPYYENKPDRPAFLDSPLALLDPIYQMYARKKPIAVCEYGASHMAKLDRVLRNDFAVNKMALMYGGLRCLYPRVKLIDWFDMDMFRYPRPGKTINNHNLTEQATVVQAYHWQVSSSYFLGEFQHLADQRPMLPRPIIANQPVGGRTRFSIWVKTYAARPKVYFKLGQKIIYASNQPGAHTFDVDMTRIPPGRQPLTAYIYDDRNHFITAVSTTVTVVQHG
ncbi:MAG: hypothetical protein JO316_02275 [Abitibacteriaceae bacterium]|nr:hypothetical protein [Abditibacteriaceae bacterium]